MDGEEIVILSGSDSSEFEVYSVSSDEETEIQPRAGNPSDCHGGSTRKNRIERSSKSIENAVALCEVTQAASKSSHKMTCQVKERTSLPAESLKNRHMYKNKTWSQVRKEKEDRRCIPPANKKARLNLPDISCSSKFTRPIHISDEDDEFSDELPDLDQRQKTPERQPVAPVRRVKSSPISLSSDEYQNNTSHKIVSKKPQAGSSPIRLSSDEEPSPSRPGLFDSLNVSNSSVSMSTSVSTNSSNKQKQPVVNKLLLTKTTKEKMASVIGNFLRQKSTNDSESRPQSPSAFSDISSCSSKRSNGNRHFLDVIKEASERSESPVPSLSDVSESTNINLEESDNEGYDSDSDEEDEDYRPENDSRNSDTESAVDKVGSDSDMSTPKKPRLGNVKCRPSGPLPEGIKKYFEPKPKETFKMVPLKGRPRHLLSYQNQYSSESDDLAAALTHLHVNTIDAAFEEGGKFFEDGLALVSDFSSRLKPTESIVKEIIGKSLLGNSRVSVCFNAFKILSSIWQKYPSCIYINWDDFSSVVGNLSLERGLCATPTESVVRGSLYLQLVVKALETDLYQRNLHNLVQIRRSAAYRYLSVDTAYANLKQIVYWVGSIVTSEYKNVSNNKIARNVNNVDQAQDSWSKIGAGYISKVLPNLQKLLQLGIQVSRNCVDAAKRVSGELVRTYIYLADIRQKKLLIQSLSSDLLKFKVTQKILEEYCDGTSLCCEDFPVSLRQVVEAYYLASPPRSLVTPPQSPSDDEAMGAPAPGSQQYSASSCEELVMLIYIITQSYLQCAHTSEYVPLAQQSGTVQKNDFSFVSERDLTQLQDAVNELHSHMLHLTSELNSATHTYLFMMHCMSRLR